MIKTFITEQFRVKIKKQLSQKSVDKYCNINCGEDDSFYLNLDMTKDFVKLNYKYHYHK